MRFVYTHRILRMGSIRWIIDRIMMADLTHESLIGRIISVEPLLQEPRMCAAIFDETVSSMSVYRELALPNASYYIGLYACLFMNIGKASVAVPQWSIERGTFIDYPNYKHVSSRLAEDIMVRHEISHSDIYRVCWIIDNIDVFTSRIKIVEIAETLHRYISADVFKNVCIAVEGRSTSLDTQLEKLESIKQHRFVNRLICTKHLYVLIAASATGKSTLCDKWLSDTNCLKTKYDSLRVELYSENGKYDYWECIQRSYADPNWNSICDDLFVDMLKTGKDVLYDNCNVAIFDRSAAIATAREFGYKVIAVTIPIDLKTLQYRQNNRRTKLTPWAVSLAQYMELEQPSCSVEEFDEIITIDYR